MNAMNAKRLLAICVALVACASLTVKAGSVAIGTSSSAAAAAGGRPAELLLAGLQGGWGSTVGPDGGLYVTEPAVGRISRVDPKTGAIRTFASGLPKSIIGLGGVTDVAFIGRTAYALVTLVGPDVGGSDIVGIYRVDGPHKFTIVADIGAFALENPPRTPFDVPTGLQFALEPYGGDFLVTDGHHNRVLRVTLAGKVTELIGFDNIVPTGLAISGRRVFMSEAGPVPHLPEDGKIVMFYPNWPFAVEVASGARLLVDVEIVHGRALYALSQGEFQVGNPPGSPALPNTGSLVKVNWDGTFDVITEGLNQPTSLEFIGNSAYVVTLGGEVWTIDVQRHRHW